MHLLVSDPERSTLAIALQMLKQIVAHKVLPTLRPTLSPKSGDKGGAPPRERGGAPRSPEHFWQARYYDFNVWTAKKRIEKLRYIHRNPVRRRLVVKPEGWASSSFRHYMTGAEGVVEIESEWTGRKRERKGIPLRVRVTLTPTPVAKVGRQGWGTLRIVGRATHVAMTTSV